MKTLYLDLFSGISGDMFIGALLDLGVDGRQLEQELSKLGLDGYHLHIGRSHKGSIEGVNFDVHLAGDHDHAETAHAHDHGHDHDHDHGHSHVHAHPHSHSHSHSETHRNFTQIKHLIAKSGLSEWVKAKTVAVFERIAIAEGTIHGLPPEQVHFHEVGA